MLKLLLPMVVPLVVAPLTVLLGQLLLNARKEIDNLHPSIKQGVIVGISAVLTAAANVLGAKFCPDVGLCTLDNLDQQALVSALLAFVLHGGLKKRKR